jgi:hypothetical protein
MAKDFWDIYSLIGTLKKNDNSEIRIAKVKKGKYTQGIDIRNYHFIENEKTNKKNWIAGKGLVIPYEMLSEFYEIINFKENI